MRTRFAKVRFLTGGLAGDPLLVPERPPMQPEWGRMLQERREQRGLSYKQCAAKSGLSDVFWAQMERGHKKIKGRYSIVKPSLGSLLQAAAALNFSDTDRNRLIAAAGFPPLPQQRSLMTGHVGRFVSTEELTPEQEDQLQQLAAFFRSQNREASTE